MRKAVEAFQNYVVIDDVEEFLNVAFCDVDTLAAMSADVFLDGLDGMIAVRLAGLP